MDSDISGYRWEEAERNMIFTPVDDAVKKLLASSPSRRSRRLLSPSQPHPAALGSLPLEIQHRILARLDPGSFAALRLVNVLTSESVAALPAFRDLIQHAPQALKALGRTRLIHQYSVSQLHDALRSDRCTSCNEYGPYLYLLNCVRCCYLCLGNHPGLISTPLETAKRILGLSNSESEQLAKLHVLPGSYNFEKRKWKKRYRLVSLETACSLNGIRDDYRTHVMAKHPDFDNDQFRFHCHASVAFPFVEPPSHGYGIQHGIWCRACHHASLCWETAYSRHEFAEHSKRCPGVKSLKGSEAS